MTTDADRFWKEVASKLRKAEGFCVPRRANWKLSWTPSRRIS